MLKTVNSAAGIAVVWTRSIFLEGWTFERGWIAQFQHSFALQTGFESCCEQFDVLRSFTCSH